MSARLGLVQFWFRQQTGKAIRYVMPVEVFVPLNAGIYSQTEKQVLKEAPKEVTGNVLRVIWCPTYIPPPPSRPTRLPERAWRDITADFITPGVSPAELFFKRKVRLPN